MALLCNDGLNFCNGCGQCFVRPRCTCCGRLLASDMNGYLCDICRADLQYWSQQTGKLKSPAFRIHRKEN